MFATILTIIVLFTVIVIAAGLIGYEIGRADGTESEQHRAIMAAARRTEYQEWKAGLLERAARARDWDAWLDELAPDETGPQQVIS